MYDDIVKRIHVKQSLAVILIISALCFIEIYFSFFDRQLVATPFILVSVLSVLYFNSFNAKLTIILGCFSVGFIVPNGFHLDSVSIYRAVEFLIASSIIYYFVQRSRDLTRDTASLVNTIIMLEKTSKKQQVEARTTKRSLNRLRKANSQLQSIVDEMMSNKELWAGSVKREVGNTKSLKGRARSQKT